MNNNLITFRITLAAFLAFPLALAAFLPSATEAQNKKAKSQPNVPLARNTKCDGVWMGPFVYNDPTLLARLLKDFSDKPVGNIPLHANAYTCLTVSTVKDKYRVKGTLISEFKDYNQTASGLLRSFGSMRGKCALWPWPLNFWPAADIANPKIDVAGLEGAVAAISANIVVGGQWRDGSIFRLASSDIIVPFFVQNDGKKLFVKTGWIGFEEPKFLSQFWNGVAYVFLTKAQIERIANYFMREASAEAPEKYSLGLTNISLKLLKSEYGSKDWSVEIDFSFDAPETVLQAFLKELNAPTATPKEKVAQPCS